MTNITNDTIAYAIDLSQQGRSWLELCRLVRARHRRQQAMRIAAEHRVDLERLRLVNNAIAQARKVQTRN